MPAAVLLCVHEVVLYCVRKATVLLCGFEGLVLHVRKGLPRHCVPKGVLLHICGGGVLWHPGHKGVLLCVLHVHQRGNS